MTENRTGQNNHHDKADKSEHRHRIYHFAYVLGATVFMTVID